MPSRSSGKTILKIKVNKKNVVISFTDKTKLDVVNEVMANFYLYEGKTLDSKTIRDIEKYNATASLLKYAMSLLKKGHLSEWKMREKLYNKEGKKEDVDYVIKTLKSYDLIDDKALILDTIEYGNERNLGKNKILQDLNNKGVFKENLNKISFPLSLEKKKAKNNLPKLERKYDKYSYEQKRQHIYRSLLSLGFEQDVALDALNGLKTPNKREEDNKLNRDFTKTYIKYKNHYEGYDLKNKVISHLKSKGYKTSEILKCWEENGYENDF